MNIFNHRILIAIPLFIFMIFVFMISTTSCTFRFEPLPSVDMVRIEREAEIIVNVSGEVKGVVFNVDKETVRQAIFNELREIFPSKGKGLVVTADVCIGYEWEIVPFFLFWPFAPFGAPTGRHVGVVEIELTATEGTSIVRYNARGELGKLQGLYYNWKYDPPTKGGIVRFALREAMDKVMVQLGGEIIK